MMNTFKKLYRDFFGLTEQSTPTTKHPVVPGLDKEDAINLANYNKQLEKTQALMKGMTTEAEIDEAKLVNGIDEYQGGVEYALKDPAQSQEVSNDIKAWVEKNGFTIIKRTISKNGKNGYFYFRLGEDPEKDAQRIQGYFAQRLELAAFRFKVRGAANPSRELPPASPKRPMRKI